jgi:O-antigen/teichoic acid export membrane protein
MKINKHLNALKNNDFIKNVLIVFFGVASAQFINLLSSPLITRIYGPEVLGVFGVFISFVAIVTPICALTYPISIILPMKDKNAKSLMVLSFYIALLFSIVMLLIIIVFKNELLNLLNSEAISSYIYLSPIAVLFFAIFQILQQWSIRVSKFQEISKSNVVGVGVINFLKISVGLIIPSATILISIFTISNLINSFLLLYKLGRKSIGVLCFYDYKRMFYLAKKYNDFPFFRAPKDFISGVSQNLPILLLSSFFGPATVAYYILSRTVISLPSQLIAKSLGDVLYPRLNEALKRQNGVRPLLMKSTVALALIGIPPFLILGFFGPFIFSIVFGAAWEHAGVYASYLSINYFFSFIQRPSAVAIPVLGLQKEFLYFEIISTFFKISVLYFGIIVCKDDLISIALFSVVGAIQFVITILYVFKRSRK